MSTSRIASHLDRSSTPQSEALPGQVPNNAGGFSFAVDDWTCLDRFLILGSEGGTYYVGERKLTLDNAEAVRRCLKEDAGRLIDHVVEVSQSGRAAKNDPALLVLALAARESASPEIRRYAMSVLPKVARIGTHLFHFVEFMTTLGGWGRVAKTGIGNWYKQMSGHDLALQVIKYQQRDGWSHRDLLRLAHPVASSVTHQELYHYVTKGWDSVGEEPHPNDDLKTVWAFERAKKMTSDADLKALCHLIGDYDLPHECVPNEMKKYPDVWEAMLPHMGMTAIVRNLGKMTSIGFLKPLSNAGKFVKERLSDVDQIKKSRLHPLAILLALKTYAQGHGDMGSLNWTPVKPIVDALDGAFYSSFKFTVPTGKRHLLGIDVSGSMGGATIEGTSLTAREASAAMALVTANVESDFHAFGFSDTFVELDISVRDRLDRVVEKMSNIPFQGTDCALPMLYAMEKKLSVDAFVVYTDSETWAGRIHPVEALKQYRKKTGIPAKLVVVGMTSTNLTIGQAAEDAGTLDVVGFDTATPSLMADFIRR